MKRDRLWKHLAICFVAALGLYIVGFTWVEHRRSRLGPWEVTFIKTEASPPTLQINQPGLDISDVTVELPGDHQDVAATNAQLRFEPGQQVPFPVPFGECVFMDPIFLPGTVTLRVYGHEIQMLPRTLTVNGEEHPWESGLHVVAPNPETSVD